jgi:hypothetical protein
MGLRGERFVFVKRTPSRCRQTISPKDPIIIILDKQTHLSPPSLLSAHQKNDCLFCFLL